MNLSSDNTAVSPKALTIKLDEPTINHLLSLKNKDGIAPSIRIRNIITQLSKTDAIGVYRG
tara:strand:- start:60 stop:242 length:183 start_codon:yes stop_codon:yes gene_type:complete